MDNTTIPAQIANKHSMAHSLLQSGWLSIIFLLLASILSTQVAVACWYPEYESDNYRTCFIPLESKQTVGIDMVKQWQQLLNNLPEKEVNKIISNDGYTIAELKELKVNPIAAKALSAQNGTLLEYIIVMRQVQAEREKFTNNAWYYFRANDPKMATLDSLRKVCLERLSGPLGDRYIVQAARAMLTLRNYDELFSLGQKYQFKSMDMKSVFMPIYASALYKKGLYADAMKIYCDTGDALSITWCLKRLDMNDDKLQVVRQLCANERNFLQVCEMLQDHIRQMETDKDYDNLEQSEVIQLIKVAKSQSLKANKYQPVWQYVEAIGHTMTTPHNYASADSVLSKINLAKTGKELRKSIRVLRFICQSATKKYDKGYISWLSNEARWLIKESGGKFLVTPDLCHEDFGYQTPVSFSRNIHSSVYYYTDMLHRAVDNIIVPRMLENADTISALQMLDIVDHANMTPEYITHYDCMGVPSVWFALECGANTVLGAIYGNGKQYPEIRKLWLDNGSFVIADRWYDLAGTALLAEARYKEAANELRKVREDYRKLRSDKKYDTNLNPFSLRRFASNHTSEPSTLISNSDRYYKLWFATEMAKLEQQMQNPAISKEQRTSAKLKYATGMANSMGTCWSLVRYGIGTPVFVCKNLDLAAKEQQVNHASPEAIEKAEIHEKAQRQSIINDFFEDNWDMGEDCPPYFSLSYERRAQIAEQAQTMLYDAIEEFENKELKAEALRELCMYRTIKHLCPKTNVAAILKTSCDRWTDW